MKKVLKGKRISQSWQIIILSFFSFFNHPFSKSNKSFLKRNIIEIQNIDDKAMKLNISVINLTDFLILKEESFDKIWENNEVFKIMILLCVF